MPDAECPDSSCSCAGASQKLYLLRILDLLHNINNKVELNRTRSSKANHKDLFHQLIHPSKRECINWFRYVENKRLFELWIRITMSPSDGGRMAPVGTSGAGGSSSSTAGRRPVLYVREDVIEQAMCNFSEPQWDRDKDKVMDFIKELLHYLNPKVPRPSANMLCWWTMIFTMMIMVTLLY